MLLAGVTMNMKILVRMMMIASFVMYLHPVPGSVMVTGNASSLVMRAAPQSRWPYYHCPDDKSEDPELQYLPRVPQFYSLQTSTVAYPSSKNFFRHECTSIYVYLFIHKA